METRFRGDVEPSPKRRMQYIDSTSWKRTNENAQNYTFPLWLTSCEETKRAGPIQISAVLKILSNKITLTCKEICVTLHIHVFIYASSQMTTKLLSLMKCSALNSSMNCIICWHNLSHNINCQRSSFLTSYVHIVYIPTLFILNNWESNKDYVSTINSDLKEKYAAWSSLKNAK